MRRTARRINYKAAAFYAWAVALLIYIATNAIAKVIFLNEVLK